ncbi:DegQ family serine endoprotease [Zooshikella sp. RANM57]|uniref:DegQ family serine endoprotease n=1 Tax=Zooshikella sp. RANM57 TaxID=3425863 RepID=UPI003D6F06A3
MRTVSTVRFLWLLALSTLIVLNTARARSYPDFTELVEDASPAVVNISTRQEPKSRQRLQFHEFNQDLPDIFRDFFGKPFPPPGKGNKTPAHSLGSGFIVSEDGYVLTNNHVISGADEIIIRLRDKRELAAKVIGADDRSDLALLKIEASDLPVVKVNTHAVIKPGQWVVAIGSPFGFEASVTAGIVSATGRNLPSENYVPFIQTDVAINPGNSGGPLLNLEGEVIGINSQIYTRSGGFMGLSFAIPMDVAMDVVKQLKDKGYVSRGWLGVMIQAMNKELAESFDLEKPMGALVAEVLEGSPAEMSGFESGDIILQFDGQEIRESSDLPYIVGRTPVGKQVNVDILRKGEKQTLKVTIGELPDKRQAVDKRQSKDQILSNRLGITVKTLTTDEKEQSDLAYGVVVDKVLDGPGRDVGLRPGDFITDIYNEKVDSAESFNDIVDKLPANKSIPMRLVRHGKPGYITFKITDE